MKFRGAQEYELKILDRLVPRGANISIDVGANDGVYSYALSKLSNKVIAFEPQIECCNFIKSANDSKITVYQAGLSDAKGSFELFTPIRGGKKLTGYSSFLKSSEYGLSTVVEVNTLDSYGFTGVSFIKIDVEGHEASVIRGAFETIKFNRPVILVEIEQRHIGNDSVSSIFNLIEGLGYQGYFYNNGVLNDLTLFDVSSHQNLKNKKYYINNFIFIPKEKSSAEE